MWWYASIASTFYLLLLPLSSSYVGPPHKSPYTYHGSIEAVSEVFPSPQLQALHALFNSTQGSKWHWTSTAWDFSSASVNPCLAHWQGVLCYTVFNATLSTNTYYLHNLTLSSLNLNGALPVALGQLTTLQELTIFNNSALHGSLPTSLCNIAGLQRITIVRSALNGTLSACWSSLQALNSVVLMDNRLSGSVPSIVCDLPNLQHLDLAFNRITALPVCEFTSSLQTISLAYNYIVGTISSTLCHLPYLHTLLLGGNQLYGSLPNCWEQSNLLTMAIGENQLTGAIPRSICSMKYIFEFIFTDNGFSGTIPNCVMESKDVVFLEFDINRLNGSLPSNWAKIPTLKTFCFAENQLTGTIPADFASNISFINLGNNQLVGTIPNSVMSSPSLKVISLYSNDLTGTIPDVHIRNQSIEALLLYDNLLDGSIPSSICAFQAKSTYAVSHNLMTGSIPHCENIVRFNFIDLEYNELEGDLLPWMCRSVYVYISNNQMSGSITKCSFANYITKISKIANNYFTGTVVHANESEIAHFNMSSLPIHDLGLLSTYPIEVVAASNNLLHEYISPSLFASNLIDLDLSQNIITGILPAVNSSVLGRSQLHVFNVSQNFLVGNISTSFYHFPKLSSLDVSYNALIGAVNFSALSHVANVFLNNNKLSGTINDFDWQSGQGMLTTIDFSQNRFSGSIPNSLFAMTSLRIVIAGDNCLTGSLPNILCDPTAQKATKLEAFALDGMASASVCTTRIFPGTSSQSYTTSNRLLGSLPECLFTDYPNLQKLHLSGNQMSGTLPNPPFISPALQSLVLSNNLLTGTIPNVIQMYPWRKMDLSFNKLSGYLHSGFHSYEHANESISLNNNRLSGTIPGALIHASTIDLLQGNIFKCDGQQSNLPVNDREYESYQCGSDSTNVGFYVWGSLSFFAALLASLWCVARNRPTSTLHRLVMYVRDMVGDWQPQWQVYSNADYSVEIDIDVHNLYNYGYMYKQLRQLLFSITAMMLFLGIVSYPIASTYLGTYAESYIWAYSAIFLSGRAAASFLLVQFSLILWFNFSHMFHMFRFSLSSILIRYELNAVLEMAKVGERRLIKSGTPITTTVASSDVGKILTSNAEETLPEVDPEKTHKIHNRSWLTNIKNNTLWALLLITNVIVSLTVNMSYVVLTKSASASSQTKNIVSILVSIFKIAWSRLITKAYLQTLEDFEMKDQDWVDFAIFMTWISLFNNILSPMISIVFYSKDCLYYVFFAQDAVLTTTSISFPELSVKLVNRFVQSFRTYGLFQQLVPVVKVVESTRISSYLPPFTYQYECTSALMTSFVPVFIYRYLLSGVLIPMMFLSLVPALDFLKHLGYPADNVLVKVLHYFTPIIYNLLRADISESAVTSASQRKLFRFHEEFTVSITDVAIAITVGTIFPPLMAIAFIAIAFRTVLNQWCIAKIVNLSIANPIYVPCVQNLNDACKNEYLLWRKSLYSIAFLLAITWGLLIFDTLGDDIGIPAIWAIPFCIVSAGLVQACNSVHERYFPTYFMHRHITFMVLGRWMKGVTLANGAWGNDGHTKNETELTDMATSQDGRGSVAVIQENPLHHAKTAEP